MVVDDEPDLLAITKMMLEKEGYKVHGFTNPCSSAFSRMRVVVMAAVVWIARLFCLLFAFHVRV